jgi:predicted CXXCH cytochrome family protein
MNPNCFLSRRFQPFVPLMLPMALLLAAGLPAGPGFAQPLRQSKHNLTAGGLGSATVAGNGASEICVFCHTPHSVQGQVPMWNHTGAGTVYTPYNSSTTKATIGQPTGDSKLCLSCHDGTVAPGMLRKKSRNLQRSSWSTLPLPKGAALLGTDLSDDHPISFVYDAALVAANGQLKDPSTLTGPVRLDKNNQMQCTSCHTSHDNKFGKFLVQNNFASALCVTCHSQNRWLTSAHKNSNRTWNGILPDPWPHTEGTTVMANGCENCHRPHSAGIKPRLLNFPKEEDNCYSCHNGNVAAKNLQGEFKKVSTHPVELTSGLHDPAEDLARAPRHITCVDCHNPHAANDQTAVAPNASGALAGVAGIASSGTPVKPIGREYELCFRCHADNTTGLPARVERQYIELNTRTEFAPSSLSFHPVVAVGRNPNVPSLILPWTINSLVYCTDCHNSNTGPGAGGTGPKGPHGSAFVPLLERRLELTDQQPENSTTYALCYKCHSRNSILGDQSFPSHNKHIVNDKTACTTCHDSHASPRYSHLINFNPTYVTRSSSGRLEFIDNGTYRGACYLSCHGKDHNPLSY